MENNIKIDKLLTAEEVAEIFQVDVQRIWAMTRRKLLPFIRFGERQFRFSSQAIEKFIAAGGNREKENAERLTRARARKRATKNMLIYFQGIYLNPAKISAILPLVESQNQFNEIWFEVFLSNGEKIKTERIVIKDDQTLEFVQSVMSKFVQDSE